MQWRTKTEKNHNVAFFLLDRVWIGGGLVAKDKTFMGPDW
jgi:hypothetical protein